ncbi:Hypothetical predicted protein [Pelobates cultripes]|nr:Hypothetical predicted protein [Pelobates cultripes]
MACSMNLILGGRRKIALTAVVILRRCPAAKFMVDLPTMTRANALSSMISMLAPWKYYKRRILQSCASAMEWLANDEVSMIQNKPSLNLLDFHD